MDQPNVQKYIFPRRFQGRTIIAAICEEENLILCQRFCFWRNRELNPILTSLLLQKCLLFPLNYQPPGCSFHHLLLIFLSLKILSRIKAPVYLFSLKPNKEV